MNQQFALALQLNDEATFEDFHWGNNLFLQQHLQPPPQKQQLYIWGTSGSGKSHLLQAYCQAFYPSESIYLPLTLLKEFGPQVLHGFENHTLICIDDIDTIATLPDWEEALFHFYNRIRDDEKKQLIISANTPPAQTNIQLADLKSRLSWGIVIQLHELNDKHKIDTLQRHAQRRGFELPTSVAQFLLSRCARNMHDLRNLLQRLDETSLAAHRKITIPFVKQTLNL